jgi:hypothetical protein
LLEGLAWTAVAAVIGLAALAIADYRLELPLGVRAAGLAVAASSLVAVFLWRVVLPLRWWTKPRTAGEIESRFPQLGQRIRTFVQYAELAPAQIHSEGVTPSLVDALEDETEARAEPLPLEVVVPRWRVRSIAALAAVPAIVLLLAAAVAPEWRLALSRALLGRHGYTTLKVEPGDVRVDRGGNLPIAVTLEGRMPREVKLYTRPQGQTDAPWRAVAMATPERAAATSRRRESTLEKVDAPLDYRIAAGSVASPTYHIDVRYPLELASFDVDLKPPAYTGVRPSTVKGGDLRVIERTEATFRIAFDAPPAGASLVLTDPSLVAKRGKKPPAPQVIALEVTGATGIAHLKLTRGLVYRIDATSRDGRVLPENRYKIEVIEDRPPRVAFEEPDEALEVHPVAEVSNRVRVADDFGLTRAGIVYQFRGGDEQTLIDRDFAKEPAPSRTTAALQEMLLLEKLAASPRDSVTYYAFAEDNDPSGPKRTETELRYIDIRPFKREYKMAESADEMGDPLDLVSLDELIARQRFNLNRASRLAKHKPNDRTVVDDPLKISGFEETLVEMTRELTAGVEGIVGQRIEPLHQAEESMLAAVSALDHGQLVPAPRHMADALRHLIESRDTLRVIIGDDPARAREMRRFDRMQAQKIRKPKKNQEEAEALAEEVEKLAQDEDFVYATLSGILTEQRAGQSKGESEGENTERSEPKNDDKPQTDRESMKGGKPQAGGEPKQGGKPEADGEPKSGGKPQVGGKPKRDDEPGAGGEPKKDDRRDAAERQEKIADKARELEERLKKLEVASELAKVRMAKAAEAAEKASVDLARGSTKEAAETAKSGAGMLHELARQLKGELARELALELAMARDLADELARREAELSEMPDASTGSQPESGEGKNKGSGSQPGDGNDKRTNQGNGKRVAAGPTDAERLEQLEEAGRTLEHWLKDASLRAVGPPAERLRDVVAEADAKGVVERMAQIRELELGGRKPAAQREAQELSLALERLSRVLDVVYRGIVAPELAKLVELDHRVAELMARMKNIKTDAEIEVWHRQAAALIRELENAGFNDVAGALADAIREAVLHRGNGPWNWGVGGDRVWLVPERYPDALLKITARLQERMQDMILKDMVSARDEATPPEFKELVQRYYEVLSKQGGPHER